MDPVNYYITTLTNAFKNIAPIIAFAIGGYLIFIKGPFLFLRKSMSDQKKKLDNEPVDEKLKLGGKAAAASHDPEVRPKLKVLEATPSQKERPQQKKQEQKKRPPRHEEISQQTPEALFKFRPGETFTQSELKKRYFELLKQNHPDRVASMGADFKTLAEKNTKDINKAFDALKKRAS